MNGGRIATPPSSLLIFPSRIPSKSGIKTCTVLPSWSSSTSRSHSLFLWDPKSAQNGSENFSRISLRCNCSSNPAGPSGQGENDSKSVLDAFFLGKALAESINERVVSTVGEFLSAIGRLQAQQQKQVQDFQEEVLERAQRAKEKAAREAMEVQGLMPKKSTSNITPETNGASAQSGTGVEAAIIETDLTNEDPLLGVSNED